MKTEKIIKLYQQLAKVASPTKAEILDQNGTVQVVTYWQQRDLERSMNSSFTKTYILNKDLNVVARTQPVELADEQLSRISSEGELRAVIRKVAQKENDEKQFLEVWKNSNKISNIDLLAQDEHLKVYNDGTFGSLEWSKSNNFLLYIAEKFYKAESFFKPPKATEPAAESETKSEEKSNKKPIPGEQYIYRQDWGEQLVGKIHPVVVIADLSKSVVSVPESLPNDVSCGQAVWTPDEKGVLFTGFCHEPRKLGLIYCSNRKSSLYHYDLEKKSCSKIGTSDCAISPVFSPDGNKFVYLENFLGPSHRSTAKLMMCSWPSKSISTIVDVVNSSSGDDFPGLYTEKCTRHCWAMDSVRVVLSTIWHSRDEIIVIDTSNSKVTRLTCNKEIGDWTVLDFKNDIIVATRTSPKLHPHLVVAKLPPAGFEETIQWTCLDEATTPLNIDWKILDFEPSPDSVNPKYGNLKFEAILLVPTSEIKPPYPLIVWPHGGPHSTITPAYTLSATFFLELGFSVLFVNYRGSLGFGQDNLISLLGNIGTQDVRDVQQAADFVKSTDERIDSKHIFLQGGSHGGYLVVSISSQYPEYYKAAIARNPVTDIVGLHSSSDIPEWSFAESGLPYTFSTLANPSDLKLMHSLSPMNIADKIKSPLLLMLGSKDLRVPYSQGLLLYHTMKARGQTVKAYIYEDGHPLSKTEHEADSHIHMARWFLDQLPNRES